jgi:hypothetical protein
MNIARKFLRRLIRLFVISEHHLKTAGVLFRLRCRLILMHALPLRKEYLVMRSGTYLPGLFSEMAAVVGLLEHYEMWRDRYAGMRVDFLDQGLYFDPQFGNNWWTYYFAPISLGTAERATQRIIGEEEQIHFARRTEAGMSRARGRRLIDRYVNVSPKILSKVDSFVESEFRGDFAIGVHYRGTDKYQEAPRVSYESVRASIENAIDELGTDRFVIFLATDEQPFLDYLLYQFGDRVRYLETVRSTDGTPIDVRQGQNFKKGQDAVLDCLLLSRCNLLIRTASNLSLISAMINPNITEVLLNRPY